MNSAGNPTAVTPDGKPFDFDTQLKSPPNTPVTAPLETSNPLILALENPETTLEDIQNLLLQCPEIDINEPDATGFRPVYIAVSGCAEDIAIYFIDRQDVSLAVNADGTNLFYYALKRPNILNHLADLDQRKYLRFKDPSVTDLIAAAVGGTWDLVDAMLSKEPGQIYPTAGINQSIFYWMALIGKDDYIENLKEHAAFSTLGHIMQSYFLRDALKGAHERASQLYKDNEFNQKIFWLKKTKEYLTDAYLLWEIDTDQEVYNKLEDQMASLSGGPTRENALKRRAPASYAPVENPKDTAFYDTKIKLINHASEYGYACKDMPLDGNCFFHCIGDQLKLFGFTEFTNNKLAKHLREVLVTHLSESFHEYANWAPEDDYVILLTLMMEEGNWAEGIAVFAMAYELNITLAIIDSNNTAPTIYKMRNPVATFVIGHMVDKHYMSLILDANIPATKSLAALIESHPYSDFNITSKQNLLAKSVEEIRNHFLAITGTMTVNRPASISVEKKWGETSGDRSPNRALLLSDKSPKTPVNMPSLSEVATLKP